jgi:hypothetical protein
MRVSTKSDERTPAWLRVFVGAGLAVVLAWCSGQFIARASGGFTPSAGFLIWAVSAFVCPWVACAVTGRCFLPVAMLASIALSASLAYQRHLMFKRYGRRAVPDYDLSQWIFALSLVVTLLIGVFVSYAVRKTRSA